MEETYEHLRKPAAHFDQRWPDYNGGAALTCPLWLPESWSGEVQRIHLRPPTYCTVDMYLKSVRENVTWAVVCAHRRELHGAGGGVPPGWSRGKYKGGRGSDRGGRTVKGQYSQEIQPADCRGWGGGRERHSQCN